MPVAAWRELLARAEHEFFRVLSGSGPLPHLAGIDISEDVTSYALLFSARFVGGDRLGWRVSGTLSHAVRGLQGWRAEFVRDATDLFWRAYENVAVGRGLEPLRERILALERQGAPAAVIHQAWTHYEVGAEHVRRHHADNPVIMLDYGGAVRSQPDSFILAPGSINYHVDPGAFTRAPPWVRHSEAERKGKELLRSWLTPAQRTQYDAEGFFDVIGSSSGRRYRIKEGRQMNVVMLDRAAREVQGYCFLPQGGLVAGDCMLAQKIALETDEAAALAVANRFEVVPQQPVPTINSSGWTGR